MWKALAVALLAWQALCTAIFVSWACGLGHCSKSSSNLLSSVLWWQFAQFMPNNTRQEWTLASWLEWESTNDGQGSLLDIPTVDVQQHEDIEGTLEEMYGKNWRRRPLLLQNIWSRAELDRTTRKLSLKGLLQENMSVPYFRNSTIPYVLSPDSVGPISKIVANITKGAPHKIGTQLLVQQNPHLIKEVAPHHLVTTLFGNFFNPRDIKGWFGGFLPGMSVVPLFVAKSNDLTSTRGSDAACRAAPRTELHCEPIGNVAVQLEGRRDWTLVSPEFSLLLRPSISPDGRAFFYSSSTDLSHVPRYRVTTTAGEALWVPTWTWHKVDYSSGGHVSIGASLFHFRPMEFVRNNPLFGTSILPNLLMELLGLRAQ